MTQRVNFFQQSTELSKKLIELSSLLRTWRDCFRGLQLRRVVDHDDYHESRRPQLDSALCTDDILPSFTPPYPFAQPVRTGPGLQR